MAQLFTTISSGQTVIIDIDDNDAIDDIKNKIQDRTGIPSTEQLLLCNGKIFRDSNIEHDRMVQLCLPIKGGAMQMYIQ